MMGTLFVKRLTWTSLVKNWTGLQFTSFINMISGSVAESKRKSVVEKLIFKNLT